MAKPVNRLADSGSRVLGKFRKQTGIRGSHHGREKAEKSTPRLVVRARTGGRIKKISREIAAIIETLAASSCTSLQKS